VRENPQGQRKEATPTFRREAPPILTDVLSSPGQPLDGETRAFMEPRFGHDFSKVRVHADSRAAESARALNATAYTVGSHVAFAQGRYEPHSTEGARLLAHELAHVLHQQRSSDLVIARKVAAPDVDLRLQQVLIGTLQKDNSMPASAGAYFYEKEPLKGADVSKTMAQEPSLIDSVFGTVRALRSAISKELKISAEHPAWGDVKLAVSDPPTRAAVGMMRATAYHYEWDIEVLVPALPADGLRGRPAIKKAAETGRLSDVKLAYDQDVEHAAVTPPRLNVSRCTLIPPDQIKWKKNSQSKLHIDAGGEGAHPEANNLNYSTVGMGGVVIPNLVCGNLMNTWPIGDRRVDIITVESSPLNVTEMERVIKPGGKISLRHPKKYSEQVLPDLLSALGNRVKDTDIDGGEVEIEIKP